MNYNLIAIDIAKTSFHAVSLKHNKVGTDKAFTRDKLKTWLAKQAKSHVVIEACGSKVISSCEWVTSLNQLSFRLQIKMLRAF